MPERGYFSQRNLIPGSVFLIVVMAFNYSLILDWLSLNYSALLGVAAALIGSPTIGFLISQIWWYDFQKEIKLYDWNPITQLRKTYKLPESLGKREALIVYDYILHKGVHSNEKTKGLSTYAFRRYDNYVLLSITQLSLILGASLGIAIRILREIYPIPDNINNPNLGILDLLSNFFRGSEFFVWIFLIATIAILISAIRKGLDWVKFDYEEMHTAIVIDSEQSKKNHWGVTRKEVEEAFPSYFPDSKTTKPSSEKKEE